MGSRSNSRSWFCLQQETQTVEQRLNSSYSSAGLFLNNRVCKRGGYIMSFAWAAFTTYHIIVMISTYHPLFYKRELSRKLRYHIHLCICHLCI